MKVDLCKVAKSPIEIPFNLSPCLLICTYWGNLPITTILPSQSTWYHRIIDNPVMLIGFTHSRTNLFNKWSGLHYNSTIKTIFEISYITHLII